MHLVSVYRYPVKGLSPEALPEAQLRPGETLADDRRFALEVAPWKFDAAAPRHMPKSRFLMLMKDGALARLKTRYDSATRILTLTPPAGNGAAPMTLDLSKPDGPVALEEWISAYLGEDLRGAVRLCEAPGHSFSDVAAKCLSMINLASLRALETAWNTPLDPLRFRANLYIDGLAPWAERDWLGKTLRFETAEGPALEVFLETTRCAATNVDPQTGKRAGNLPARLLKDFGANVLGVYAECLSGGRIAPGDSFILSA